EGAAGRVRQLAPADAQVALYGPLDVVGDGPAGNIGTVAAFTAGMAEPAKLQQATKKDDQFMVKNRKPSNPSWLVKPEHFQWSDPKARPDFSRGPTDHYQYQHPLYGQVEAYQFPSENGKYNYVICKDSTGRAWVNSVEAHGAATNSFGVSLTPIDAGELTTPPLEYYDQIPRGYEGLQVKGKYYDATKYVNPLLDKAFGPGWRKNIGL